MVLPIASKSGIARSKSSASPPTMMLNVPAMAPLSPPLTGASSARAPRSRSAASTSTAVRGGDRAHVDEQCPLAQRRQQPVFAEDDVAHIG